MAQSTLHFSFGMLIGTLTAFPRIYHCWQQRQPLANAIARWLMLSYALGLYATIPAILRRLLANSEIGTGIGWNIFFLYPLFDHLRLPSIIGGEMAIAALFSLQYVTILIAIRRARRSVEPQSGHRDCR